MKKNFLLAACLLLSFFVQAQYSDNGLANLLVSKNSEAIGLSKDDLSNYMVSNSYFDKTSGMQHVYLTQTYKGLPVFNQIIVLAFKGEKLMSHAGSFLKNMDTRSNGQSAFPANNPSDAVRAAFTESKVPVPASVMAINTTDNGKKVDFGKLSGARENVTAELIWVPVEEGRDIKIKLGWQVSLALQTTADYWVIRVDASRNTVLNKNNYTIFENLDNFGYKVQTSYYDAHNILLWNGVAAQANTNTLTAGTTTDDNSPLLVTTVNYTVIPYPAESPIHPGGTAAVRTNPWTLAGGNAVSLGWHNDGTLDYTTSRGNNVHAHEDQANNNSNAGIMATSTTSPDPLNFNFPPNYTVAPTTASFQQFALTNLFYWNNICHDITYKYGFDEPGGNFQNSNQGRGGVGTDYVQADGQDGGGLNNANMSTPPDGNKPRMQMYLWSPPAGVLTFVVNSPASIAGPYTAVEGAMSTANLLGNVGPVTGQLIWYNDDVAGTLHEACAAPANTLTGKVALIKRGTCTFAIKVKNAQVAGALAVVMVNNVPGAPIVMGGTDNTIIIPAIMISDVDGATIAAQVAGNVNITMSSTPPGTIQLDGDIDNGIITHEFFHGVSNRLTGGPATTSCLGNAEEGGEGWSDYFALMLTTDWSTAAITDGVTKPRAMGTYAFGQAITGAGIRNYKYCTDIAVNPLTYANMGVAPIGTEVHNIGEIWCEVLWEMTWSLIQTDGINTNLFNNAGAGGNSVAFKLMMEGLKLQPCSPGFIDARNAILTADQNLYGGAHYCAIWTAFAKRGMGWNASQGSSASATDQTPTFTLPPSAVITTQPSAVSVCAGANTTFTVAATGTNLTYQWQVSTNGGGTWSNLTNAAPYSGVTTVTLTVTGVTVGMNANQYRCVVGGGCAAAVNSNAVTLTVGSGAPAVTTQPSNANVCAGTNATFTVAATGTPLTYQWQESTNGGGTWTNITNGGIYSGATTVTLTLTGVTVGMNAYQYRCAVSGGCGGSTTNSNAGILSVFTGGTTVTSHPSAVTSCVGTGASFTVAATGPALTYQWQESTNGGGTWTNITNGGIYSGATTVTLSISAVTAVMNNYQYRCIVTGSCPPAATSNAAILTVNTAPAVTTQPVNVTVCVTTSTSFSIAANGAGLTYQWQESTNGGGTWTNITNGGIYSGATTSTVTLTGVTVGMNTYQYRCVVSGTCSPAANSNAGILTVVTLSTGGTLAPANTVYCTSTNTGTITLSGYTGNVIQWESATNLAGPWSIIANTTTTLTYTNLSVTTYYRAFVQASGCAGAYSTTAAVQVTSLTPMIIISDVGTTICNGDPARLTVMDGGVATPVTVTQSSSNTITPGNSVACNAGGLHTDNSYYRVYPLALAGPFTINTVTFGIELASGGPQPVTVNLYTNSGAAFPNGTLTLVGSQAATVPTQSGTLFTVTFATPPTVAGNSTLVIELFTPSGQATGRGFFIGSNSAAQTGASYIKAALCGITNPVDLASIGFPGMHIILGASGTTLGGFSVVTGGTFLWTPAAGLSSTTSNPVAASPITTTTYTVTHNNGGGCIRTASITLNVNQRPVVTLQPNATSICTATNASFTVAATGTGISYQWQESTNAGVTYTNITNGGVYAGATTTTLTITGAPFTMNGNRYRCAVTGICPPVAYSNGAILTVKALPNVAVTPTSGCGGVAGINGLLLSTGSLAPPVPGTATFTSGPISVAIPEGNFPNPPATAATHTIAVSGIPGTATVTGISIKSNITHAYVGDVVMVLKAPNGQIFNLDALLNKTNNPGANFVNTVISSTGVTALDAGTAPFTGTFKADAVGATFTAFGFTLAGGPVGYTPTTSAWSSLYSTPNGNWTIAAYDAGAPDLGNLTSWEIKIDYTTPGGSGSPLTFTWAPAAGLYNNATTTNAYVAGTQTPSVYAAPTQFTAYTVTGTDATTGCSNTATALVNYTPPAPTVTPNPVAMCLGDAAVRLVSSSATATTVSFNSGPITVNVPDNSTAGTSNNLTVAGIPANGNVSGLKVTWNMTHTWDGDMVFVLKSATGAILNLDYFLSSTGGAGATTGFVNTAVGSTGVTALGAGSGTYTGLFKADALLTGPFGPTGPTGYLPTTTSWAPLYGAGVAANGTYTLAMYDGGAGDVGVLTSWNLDVTYVVGVPSTAATWSPVGGLFTDPAATVAYTGTPRDTVYTRPTPTGVYNYNVTVNSLPLPPAVPATPMAGGNGNNMVLFNVANNNSIQYTLTSISTNAFATGVATAVNLYRSLTPIAGNPGAITAGNGWALVGTASNVSVTANTLNNVLSGLNVAVPAGATYGLALEFTGAATFPAYTNGSGVVKTYTSNGCSIITDGNIGWGGPVAPGPPANNPRNFNGTVSMVASVAACTSPSRTVVVTVNTPITITAQPVNAVVCTDKTTTFTVAAAGTTPSYQWQVSTDAGTTFTNISNGGAYSGATTATLTLTAPPVSYNGYIYRCMVSGAAPCPPVPSAGRVLTVNPLPTIVISASPYQNLLPTLSTTLFSTSSPAAATYTWLRNGFAVSGATASSLLIRVDGQGSYRLRVVDVNGCVNLSNTVVIGDSTSGRVFISPNPTSGQFVVRYNPAHNIVTPDGINIFDAMGKRVLTQKYTLGIPFAPMAVDLSNQATGVYWVEVVDLDGNRLAVGRVEVVR